MTMLTSPLIMLLGGIVLLCAFLQISQRRLTAMLMLSQISALALGLLAFWQGWHQHIGWFYVLAVLILAAQCVAFPWVIRRISTRFQNSLETSTILPLIWSLAIGLLPVALAVMGLSPLAKTPWPADYGALALAFSVTLLGIWLIVIQRQYLPQMIGFVTFENGLVLALISMPGLGWGVDIALVVLLGLATGLILLGMWRSYAALQTKVDGACS